MSFVLKIKYGDSLRRLVIEKRAHGPAITFNELEAKVREYFGIATNSKLVITYVDKDEDVVTMSENSELVDACVSQGLNPLRLFVSVEEGGTPGVKPKAGDVQPVTDAVNTVFKFFDSRGIDASDLKQPVLDAFNTVFKLVDGHADLKKITENLIQAVATPRSGAETSTAAAAPVPVSAATPAADVEAPSPNLSDTIRSTLHDTIRSRPDAVHFNVQCDSCGISPIVGPRFKSTKKHNFDLCTTCFQDLPKGSECDYVCYDKPMPFRYAQARCPALYRPRHSWRDMPSYPRHEWDLMPTKPDGRFVADVTIPDGTLVSPGTRFVKIWRLRNSGRIPWACNTKLVRVGGDEMGSVSAVALQMPSEAGLAPEAELEVAVDLVAPAKIGRYVSYWRLMTPFGVKFGHRVWALIQVASAPPDEKESLADSLAEFSAEVECAAEVDDSNNGLEVVSVTELPEVETGVISEVDNVTPEVDNLLEERGDEKRDAEEVESLKSELEGFSLIEMPKTDSEAFDDSVNPPGEEDPAQVLESMGFADKALIKQFLEKNQNDIQRTIDDLVAAADWDPILEELEEMGFYDTDMNRRLMIKNNGSMKRVVKELVQLHKF